MKKILSTLSLLLAVQTVNATSLTIYEDYALISEHLALQLQQGKNQLDYHEITRQLEPESVMLTARDPSWHVLASEQNYYNSPLTVNSLLEKYEGKTINFEIKQDNHISIIEGKVLRARPSFSNSLDSPQQPIFQIDGEVRFGLPGTPLFPKLDSDTILKPKLSWELYSNKTGLYQTELSYLSRGFSWKSDYNILLDPKSLRMDVTGWITVNNDSGKDFDSVLIKFIAGEVNKVSPEQHNTTYGMSDMRMLKENNPQITEKSFDEFHLYSAPHPLTLKTASKKQVQFLNAAYSKYTTEYTYDGVQLPSYFNPASIWQDKNFGTNSSNKIGVYKTFDNTEKNNLGKPFPKGRVRFYQKDDDGMVIFVGENTIDHTPKNEQIRIFTGNAFDVKGERKQLDFKVDSNRNSAQETIEITLTNRKNEDVTINVKEHFFRGPKHHITRTSSEWEQKDSTSVETKVFVPADSIKVVRYTVQYQW